MDDDTDSVASAVSCKGGFEGDLGPPTAHQARVADSLPSVQGFEFRGAHDSDGCGRQPIHSLVGV